MEKLPLKILKIAGWLPWQTANSCAQIMRERPPFNFGKSYFLIYKWLHESFDAPPFFIVEKPKVMKLRIILGRKLIPGLSVTFVTGISEVKVSLSHYDRLKDKLATLQAHCAASSCLSSTSTPANERTPVGRTVRAGPVGVRWSEVLLYMKI